MGFIKSNNQTNFYLSTDIRNIFVGRVKEVNFFIREILEPEDPTYNIISIWGNPGVGKSTLLTKFIDIAREPIFKEYCLAAQVDERQATPSSIMEKIADQLRIAGYPLVDFEQGMYTYNEALRNLRANQSIEQKMFIEGSVFTSATPEMRNNLILHRYLGDRINSATQNFEASYRYRQLSKDVERIDDPIAELTNAFISDLNRLANTSVALSSQVAKHQRRVLLFFDSFEQLANDVTPWLLEYFLEANISANIVLVVAGHAYIERSVQSYQRRWQKHKSIIYPISLDSFTESEAHEYFNVQGITDADHISILWRLSEGLPYSLSLLTSSTYREVDVTKNVVDNFLRGIPESEEIKRKLALEASLLSRPFNQDDLKAFTYLTEKNRAILYRWLCEQPFVHSNPLDGRHNYHDLARNNFSRHLYQDSPERYRSTREALASHYQQLLESMQAETGFGIYKTAEWLELMLALIHQLFLLPDEGSHINAIEKTLEAYKHTNIKQDGEIIRFLRGISEDGPTNMATKDAQRIAISLIQYIETSSEKRVQEFLAATSFFIQKLSQIVPSKALLLARIYHDRGNAYVSLARDEQALADFNRAIECNSSYTNAYISRARLFRRLKNYNDALVNLDCATQVNPDNELLFITRGQIYQDLKRYEDALNDFEHAIKLDMKLKPLLYMLKGQLLLNMRRYKEADDSLTKGLTEDPEFSACWTLLAQVYRVIHPYQEIPGLLKALSIPKSDSNSVIIYRAEALSAVGHYEEASSELKRIIELEPQNIRAITELGKVYSKCERYEEAINYFTLALEIEPKYVDAFVNRGRTYWEMHLYIEALSDLSNALVYKPKNVAALFSRSQIYRDLGQYHEALRDLDSIMKIDPYFEHEVLEEKGKVLKGMDKSREALDTFVEALKIEPNCSDCWIDLAKTYGTLNRYSEIPRLLREVPIPIKDQSSAIACLGMSMFTMKNYEDALKEFNCAIRLDQDNEQALIGRSRTYIQFNAYQKALEDIEHIMKHSVGVKHAVQASRGKVLLELGRNEDALDAFIEALKTEPICDECWINLVISYELLKGQNETVQWLRQLSITNWETTLAYRAKALAYSHHYQEALQILMEALKIKPNDFQSMFTLSQVYMQLKRYVDALTTLTEALKLRPRDGNTILKRGQAYYYLNRPREALKDFDHLIKSDLAFEHEGQQWKGIALYSLQRYSEAINAFSLALRSEPTCIECWSRLACTYEASFAKSAIPELLRRLPISKTNKALMIANRSLALSNLSYYREALIDLNYAFALDEIAVSDYYTHRGLIFSYLKLYDEAIEDYNKDAKYGLSFQNLYNIAVAMVRWKGFPDAQEYIDIAYEALLAQVHTINYVGAFYGLGGLAALTGNISQALSYLRQAISIDKESIIEWAKHDIAWLDLRYDKRFEILISDEEQVEMDEANSTWKKNQEQQNNSRDIFFDSQSVNELTVKNTSSLKVFLCYSPDDKVAVQDLYHRLQRDGIDPWLDENNLLPGQNRENVIRKAVRSSSVVIVCLSSSAQTAGHIHKHISYALEIATEQPENEIFIIPAKLGECDIPERLSQWQSVNLQDEEGYERLIQSLQLKFPELNISN